MKVITANTKAQLN